MAIILLALLLRVRYLEYIEFRYDEAAVLMRAARVYLDPGHIPLHGMRSSLGNYGPHGQVYMMLPVVKYTFNPVAAAGYMLLFDVAAVFMLYILCAVLYTKRVGYFASLFYAVSPWTVLFGRKIWVNNFMPSLVLCLMISLVALVVYRRSYHILPALVSLGILSTMHFTALVYWGVFIIIYFVFKPPVNYKFLAAGLVFCFLASSPYLYYEVTHDLYNTRFIVYHMLQPSRFNWVAFTYPLQLVSTMGLEYSLGGAVGGFTGVSPTVNILCPIIFLVGLLHVIRVKGDGNLIVLVFLAIPFLLVFLKSQPLIHYMIPSLPVVFLVFGVGLDRVYERLSRVRESVGVFLIIFLLMCLFASTLAFQDYILTDPPDTAYGTPYTLQVKGVMEAVESGDVSGVNGTVTGRYILYNVLGVD